MPPRRRRLVRMRSEPAVKRLPAAFVPCRSRAASALALLATLATFASFPASARPLAAQESFRIVVDSVSDSRARTAAGDASGRLTLKPKLEGEGLADAKAFRIRLAAATDDTGRDLLPDEPAPATWEESATGEGLWILLASPARGAEAATISGTVDLWIPRRDPKRDAPTKKSTVSVPFELKGVPLP